MKYMRMRVDCRQKCWDFGIVNVFALSDGVLFIVFRGCCRNLVCITLDVEALLLDGGQGAIWLLF